MAGTLASGLIKYAKYAFTTGAVLAALYAGLLGLLTTPSFQAQVIYLHNVELTWSKTLDVPEQFGFLRNQVTPFSIGTPTGSSLFAWHILPIELYRSHQAALVAESSGHVLDVRDRLAFQLLRDDPKARLVIHMHGAAGTVGSGYRVPNYRALSAGDPHKIHVLTFDYRGFGRSKGTPSERGLCDDAIAAVDWAMNVAGIPPSRILFFGQSLGTAVTLAVSEHYAVQSPPVAFAGMVLVAPFVDVATLMATYRIAGKIPIVSPLARFPALFDYLRTLVHDKWSSKDRIAQYIRANEANGLEYRITLIHAEDDFDIPFMHTQLLFWHAINATFPQGIGFEELEDKKTRDMMSLGAAGSVMEWKTRHGVITEQVLKHGLHDIIMGNPVVTLAVMRAFEGVQQ